MQKESLSAAQTAAVLDNAPVAVYVSALKDFELLYANKPAEDTFLRKAKTEGMTCYQMVGFDAPCPYCSVGKMKDSEFLVREFSNSATGRIYQLSGKLIDWEGEPAHIEYMADITEKKKEENQSKKLEKELADANGKMQDIINAIPGGVAIYKISDIFETVYFSDGVPELSGYTVEEYRELVKNDAADMIYSEDKEMVKAYVREVTKTRQVADFEFRKLHRNGYIVWVRAQIKWIGEEDGCPMLHCVFHNISELREAQFEMRHLVNSIPGGIASYRVEGERFIPTFYSDGVMRLSGHTREEYEEVISGDIFNIVYEPDRKRLMEAAKAALISGMVLDVSYRIYHKNGNLIWIHLNGRRMGPVAEVMRLYAVFTGMSEESRLYQSIANETEDGIYVIDRENYDLLYANDSEALYLEQADYVGRKCYAVLHGKSSPCEFCGLSKYVADGMEHEMQLDDRERYFKARFKETDWNGIPAYIIILQDNTQAVKTRREKERLEEYFQTVIKNLPGGICVVRYEEDGSMIPEFLSDGFAAMTGMTLEEAWDLYQTNAMNGVHPEDRKHVQEEMDAYIAGGGSHCEIVYRLIKGDKSYIWVKNSLSLIQNEGGERRVYAVYHDITKERREQEQILEQYRELILQHYKTPGPNALVIGHGNITKNRILELIDHTNSGLLQEFGCERNGFFMGLSSLMDDKNERREFLNRYLNKPLLEAFERNETEQVMNCFIKLPHEDRGRYVQFKVNLVEAPDTGDITGILTVTDTTEETVTELILHQLYAASYDFVIDLDLDRDEFTLLAANQKISMPRRGSYSARTKEMLRTAVVPKDRDQYEKALSPETIRERLKKGPYTFSYSMLGDNGDIRTKNMTVSDADMRIGRVCLVRADITESVREQQGLLNMMVYTFELMGFIDIQSRCLTMYTRQIVLENLAPYIVEHYDAASERLGELYNIDGGETGMRQQFRLDVMLKRLAEKPSGYDFVFSMKTDREVRYKQVNVLWGDENHRTICLVRADVTDMLSAERETKKMLENALAVAEEANRAKSDFLSAMSHDIRTPMNAIMGMTSLAIAHLSDRERVADCLQKITVSSRHLLSLINDILDMSKIERSKITLNDTKISLSDMTAQLSGMMRPQAESAGISLDMRGGKIGHTHFYGDFLRLNQILINIVSNAIKFTPKGGRVDFLVEELPPEGGESRARYRFTVKDTGVGMSEEFIAHIFEPFTRSENSSHVEGTGLGLSITKGLVDLMGGRISVESRPGEGSVFLVELEFDVAEAENDSENGGGTLSAGPDTDKKNKYAGRLFLVAEDNSINAEILVELLKLYGAKSVVRTDGAEVVREFENSAPGAYDAILMDIQMPEMNGYEAARAIRKSGRTDAAQIPIIAMTANAFTEDVQEALAAGMDAHVSKPIEMDVLEAALDKVFAKSDKK